MDLTKHEILQSSTKWRVRASAAVWLVLRSAHAAEYRELEWGWITSDRFSDLSILLNPRSS